MLGIRTQDRRLVGAEGSTDLWWTPLLFPTKGSFTLQRITERIFFFFLKKWANRPLFRLFSSFQTNITILTTNKCEKMPIQDMALGFKLTIF